MIDLDPAAIPSIGAAESVRGALSDRIRTAVSHAAEGSSIVRVGVPVPETVEPLDWMRAHSTREAVYWSGRDDDETVAALGAADVIESDAAPVEYEALDRRLRNRLQSVAGTARYYGGLRFDVTQPAASDRPDRHWTAFGTYRFVLPRFELVSRCGSCSLICNLVLPRDAEQAACLLEEVNDLILPAPADPASLPRPHQRRDVPDRSEWTRMVRWALDSIEGNALDKVVLARRVELALDHSMDPLLVLHHLQAATPGSFHFAIRPEAGPTFIGASPERLFRREEGDVESEAVAGTRSRGDTPEEDAALREALLESPKERREHAFVQDAIRDDLSGVCASVEIPNGTRELALARGRHLYSRLTGTLCPGASTIDLLEALHPTPAVGGVPTQAAVAAIRAREPFDRGWYAGPVGWIGSTAAEFAVALRAGLVQEDQLALFSGAGIVDGSEPESEWDEIEQKIGDFAAILGLTEREKR